VTNWYGVPGNWNDLPCDEELGYLIEFGGRPGETSTANAATLTRTVTAVNPTVISVPAIGGVTAPVTGAVPVATVTAANGYTGTVTWSPVASTFATSTQYTATITLTPASSYTLTGVAQNFFTVAGASATNAINAGVVTAVFPATTNPRPTISGPSPITGTVGSAITPTNLTLGGGTDTKTATVSPNSALPTGLTLTSAGLISGTPGTAGTSSTSFTVTDSLNETATATIEFVIALAPAPPAPAPVVAKDPDQTSSISTITQGCPTDANTVVIKGSFLAPITNIFINNQLLNPSLWKQSATQVVITINPSDESALSIQIFNGQVPLLPLQSLTEISRCLVPAPIVTPTPTPTPKPTPSATATPKPTPTPTNTPQPSTEMVKVGTVYMASGSYSLNDATKKSLIAVAKKINASGAKTILVYGHSDSRGGVNNTVLSQNRAKAVAAYLRPLLTVKKISIGWYSSNKPVKAGTSAAALAQNRRVEIYTK
jgi:outer membrane protein OmpA-like peptidoglycan-associated protein